MGGIADCFPSTSGYEHRKAQMYIRIMFDDAPEALHQRFFVGNVES